MSAQKNHPGLALNGSDKLNDKVSFALTGREVLLLDLCLGLIARHYAQKSTLSFDIPELAGQATYAATGTGRRNTKEVDRDECQNR